VSSNKPKKLPKGDYPVGYGRPPKSNQFQPGQSGNLGGRPRGRPALDAPLLEGDALPDHDAPGATSNEEDRR